MSVQVPDQVWEDFHQVVNMTSRELEEWLRTRDSTEEAEAYPDRAGTPTGRRVLAILAKRRTDLTEQDAAVMRRVIETVRSRRTPELEPKAGDPNWRHRLMTLGHDPLKPS
jgi:hypothetical protein